MNLIYCCAFYNREYSQLVEHLVASYSQHDHTDTHLLIMCHSDQVDVYKEIVTKHNLSKVILFTRDVHNKLEAACARLHIFEYPEIDKYDKIFYIDCDVLVMDSLNNIFTKQLDDKLYTCMEWFCSGWHWDYRFKLPEDIPAPKEGTKLFTSAMLLFNNCETIKKLFNDTLQHITEHINEYGDVMPGLDQPFIIYNTILNGLQDINMLLEANLVLNLGLKRDYTIYDGQTIVHFPGTLGNHTAKLERIKEFSEKILKI